jgi:hypothetical protein
MTGLLGLCSSILEPEGKTYQPIKIVKPKINKQNGGNRMAPPYSPLWYDMPTQQGRSFIVLKRGIRSKKCPCCKKWKGADTLNYCIEKKIRIGISSWCRECVRAKNRKQ